MRVGRLRCEQMLDPLGLDEPRPLLQWAVDGDEAPRSVRVLAARDAQRLADGDPDLWASDAMAGTTAAAVYDGVRLGPRDGCVWQVEVRTRAGATVRSPTARFELGLLVEDDWRASWIGAAPGTRTRNHRPCPYMRREFDVGPDVEDARLYMSALGAYRVWVNGAELTADRLAPGWSDYRRRVPYRTYDPSRLLRPGRNAIAVLLGDAWWCGRVGPYGRDRHYGDAPYLRAQLELRHGDGAVDVVGTDESWECGQGSEIRSDLQLGEIRDSRREPDGWTLPGFTAGWGPAVRAVPTCGPMTAARWPAVRVTEEIEAPDRRRATPTTEVVDLGTNIAGWLRLDVEGEEGAEIVVRHGEVLDARGRVYVRNLRAADATDRYVLRGGHEVLEPSFTSHGFRFAEIAADPAKVSVRRVTGRVAHSDLEPTGTFACSDPRLEAIHRNVVRTQRGNSVDIPTDCPQRDERLGWLGDALAFGPTAVYGYDLAAWLGRWLEEVRLAQSLDGAFPDVAPLAEIPGLPVGEGAPGWGDAGVVLPWLHYVWYGDVRVLARMFPAACAWVDRIAAANPDRIWRSGRGNDYGDWMAWEETPKEVVATAFLARSVEVLARSAEALGADGAARRYRVLRREVGTAFAERFVDAAGRVAGGSQTAYATALRFGLVPPALRPAAEARLVDAVSRAGTVRCGYLGIPHLLPALTDAGAVELAYTVAQTDEMPGWGHMLRSGATTMWERWDAWSPDRGFHAPWLNSFNHPSLGSIGEWLHATVGGVAPDPRRPGFGHVDFAPRPGGGLTTAETRLETVRGEVACAWALEDGRLTVDLTVPATATATLRLPCGEDVALGPGRHTVRRTAAVVS